MANANMIHLVSLLVLAAAAACKTGLVPVLHHRRARGNVKPNATGFMKCLSTYSLTELDNWCQTSGGQAATLMA